MNLEMEALLTAPKLWMMKLESVDDEVWKC